MFTKTLTNDAIFASLDALGEVYQQPLKISRMQKIRETIDALQEKARSVQELRERIAEDHGGEVPEEDLRELGASETEVTLPQVDVAAMEDVRISGPQYDLLKNLFAQPIPDDFPCADKLREAGITTLDAARSMNGQFDEVDGIGDSRAEEIEAELASRGN